MGSDKWFENEDPKGSIYLPNTFVPDLYLEAIDATNTKISYDSFDNFSE